MNSEKLYNVLEGFNFDLLLQPEFKEDSVREEIIVPIIKGLGYTANLPNQIIRSRKLLHPFVSIGSQRKPIHIIPDYLFEVNGKPAWILDAKSPLEKITNSNHTEQAYSYAIHSEVRVKYYALCNGLEFVLYNIEEVKPMIHIPLTALPINWDTLKKCLAPENVLSSNPFHLAKDLGLHLKRLGFDSFKSLIFPKTPIDHITQLEDLMFTTSTGLTLHNDEFVVTFDFDIEILNQLHGKIPEEVIKKLLERKPGEHKQVRFTDRIYYVNIDCNIGENLAENDKEIFYH
ncbi:MAG: type I restriction enzyme HsdR N-terminal domain-containing protein [Bacteroidetes bacterium]|nr:type I restriction enzyme HsdR N-terminal domain-containing protein [Bacteroidota bacterium]